LLACNSADQGNRAQGALKALSIIREQRIAKLKSKIEATRLILERYEIELASLNLWNANTPFSRPFPPEIIDSALKHVLLDPKLGQGEEQALQRTAVRLVCRDWNSMIISKPAFWTKFFVQVNMGHRLQLETQLRTYAMQLPRTLDEGLHFTADGGIYGLDPSDEHDSKVDSLISLVRESSPRWSTIDISGLAFNGLASSLFARPESRKTHWNSLRTLSVSSGCRLGSDNSQIDLPPNRFPLLEAIYLPYTTQPLLRWNLPWSQLKHLSFETYTDHLNECLSVLGQCVRLETLKLITEGDAAMDRGDLPRMTLPSLLSFQLEVDQAHYSLFTGILLRLTLPRLQSLEICDRWSTNKTKSCVVLQTMRMILQESKCELQSLYLYSDILDPEDAESPVVTVDEPTLGALLHDVQNTLRKLTISVVGLTGEFLRGFEPECLEEFDFRDCLPPAVLMAEGELVGWLEQQMRREGGRERCRRMKTTLHREDTDYTPSNQWYELGKDGYPFFINP